MSRRAEGITLFLLAALFSAPAVRAELADDVAELTAHWKQTAVVAVLPPRVLSQPELVPLLLPEAAVSADRDECTTVAVLGALSTGFVLRFLPKPGAVSWGRGEASEPSIAGAAQLVRCGPRRSMLRRLAVEMRSPRGVVQTIVARGKRPAAALRGVLEHREPGAAAASIPPGPRPPLEPVARRAERLQALYEQRAALELDRKLVPAKRDGSARVLFHLPPGCHRIHVLGITPEQPAEAGLDLDAELRWADSGDVADLDRTDSPDASVGACAGRPRTAVLTLVGGIPGVPALVMHARWDLPEFLPERWGAEPRAQVAAVLWREGIQPLDGGPYFESLGVGGSTRLPIEQEPDACYVAVITVLRGELKLLALAMQSGNNRAFAHSQDGQLAVVLAYCAAGELVAELDVEAHGASLAWLAAVWRTARRPLGSSAE